MPSLRTNVDQPDQRATTRFTYEDSADALVVNITPDDLSSENSLNDLVLEILSHFIVKVPTSLILDIDDDQELSLKTLQALSSIGNADTKIVLRNNTHQFAFSVGRHPI